MKKMTMIIMIEEDETYFKSKSHNFCLATWREAQDDSLAKFWLKHSRSLEISTVDPVWKDSTNISRFKHNHGFNLAGPYLKFNIAKFATQKKTFQIDVAGAISGIGLDWI